MSLEDNKNYAKNWYNELGSLNKNLNHLLNDDRFAKDEDLLLAKKELEKNMEKLNSIITKIEDEEESEKEDEEDEEKG